MAIAWRITNRCNLGKCFFCRIGDKSTSDEHELKFEKVKQICSEYNNSALIDNNSKKIYITGGEPFIRKDMVDIIEYIVTELEIPLSIVTNSLLIDERAINVLEHKLVEVSVSLDGLEADHNKIRKSNTFNNTIQKVQLMVQQGVIVDVLPTITKYNNQSFLSDEFIYLLNNHLQGIRYLAVSRIDNIGYGKKCQEQNISQELYCQILQHLRNEVRNIEIIERKPRVPSLRIDNRGNVHVLAEMEGNHKFIDGNLNISPLDEIIAHPSYYWLFHKSSFSKERILWELIQQHSEYANSTSTNLLQDLIDKLSLNKYMG